MHHIPFASSKDPGGRGVCSSKRQPKLLSRQHNSHQSGCVMRGATAAGCHGRVTRPKALSEWSGVRQRTSRTPSAHSGLRRARGP